MQTTKEALDQLTKKAKELLDTVSPEAYARVSRNFSMPDGTMLNLKTAFANLRKNKGNFPIADFIQPILENEVENEVVWNSLPFEQRAAMWYYITMSLIFESTPSFSELKERIDKIILERKIEVETITFAIKARISVYFLANSNILTKENKTRLLCLKVTEIINNKDSFEPWESAFVLFTFNIITRLVDLIQGLLPCNFNERSNAFTDHV